MILFVETNFVLELAFEQEDRRHCRALLDLAKGREDLEMALPASCILEAYHKQVGRGRKMADLHSNLVRDLGELSRSKPYAGRSREVRELTAFMATTGGDELKRLDAVLSEIYAHATVLPLDQATAARARRPGRARNLEPQDGLVYASVLSRLSSENPGRDAGNRTAPTPLHCFLTRDRHFTDPDLQRDLAALGCRVIFRFEDGLRYVRAQLT